MKLAAVLALALACAACAPRPPAHPTSTASTARTIALPGAHGPLSLDYLASDGRRVWVPAAQSGNVDVLDGDGRVSAIAGFATGEIEREGRKRAVGPSSVSIGDGVVFIGDRADSSVCAVDAATLARRGCLTLPARPDGIAWVRATRELWVTTPGDRALVIVDGHDVDHLALAGRIAVDGEPEGFAVDEAARQFHTNLEDQDATLTFDVGARRQVARWPAGCGGDGPRGLALDGARGLLFVACSDGARALDLRSGAARGRVDLGAGVDDIFYRADRRTLYAAAAGTGTLALIGVGDDGQLALRQSFATAPGARNAVVTDDGVAFVGNGRAGTVVMLPLPR